MKFISEMYKSSEAFQMFSMNSAIGKRESDALIESLREIGTFSKVTERIIVVMIENQRFKFIKKIADHYQKLYQTFNKEEKITIISAADLDAGQKKQVQEALKQNPQNQGKEFVIEYQVDGAIQGGL
jgi:F-type H+-transporting ATPase subunit O